MSASPFNSVVGAAPPRNAPSKAAAAAAPPAASSSTPAGAFATGTKIQVGTHRVIIERYLSEGGFAHVYLVRLPRPVNGSDVAVLKRVAVPDKEALANMRTEVETMKKLQGHIYIVTYIDSHASQLRGGGYEVFLLMEYCQGGGLIDFMNTRLQNRLTEPEILHIFSDVAEGVACMHYLKPPLLHRDLKVENVLISSSGKSRRYKLCDFGSTAPPRPAATSAAECRLIEDDVQKHTTLQYRSPEMIDVYRKQPIDEKSDVWALGVLLYKLCYYTTPFEEQGQLAILNASFKFPGYPAFSDRLKKLIASLLREKPQARPNIYQILREVCTMRGVEVPVKDIYTGRSQSEARKNQQLPSPEPTVKSPPVVGAVRVAPEQRTQAIPEITPMRRGRPTSSSQPHSGTKPSPSPGRVVSKDPFAALDSTAVLPSDAAQDELSSRFPRLDQFSLLVDSGGKFEFEPPSREATVPTGNLSQRVTEKLADDAFAQSRPTRAPATLEKSASVSTPKPSIASRDRKPDARPVSSHQSPLLHQPSPQRPGMVSQGTMTSPSPSPPEESSAKSKPKRSYHFPRPSLHGRSSSQPRITGPEKSKSTPSALHLQPNSSNLKQPILSDSRTQELAVPKSPASSRPSLEGNRPSSMDMDSALNRSKSATARPRPSSVYVDSNLEFLRDREMSRRQDDDEVSRLSRLRYEAGDLPDVVVGESNPEDTNISSNVDFLRAMEEEDNPKRKEKRASSGSKHSKRSSLPSISLSNSKSLFAGRFGDAFRRFEGNAPSGPERTSSPTEERGPRELTPIAGSERTGDQSDEEALAESEEIPAETRRELERRRLAQEERRVETATAEYRQRMSTRDGPSAGKAVNGGGSRAASIQNKVKDLLDENTRPSLVMSSALESDGGGSGRITDLVRPPQVRNSLDARESPATATGTTVLNRTSLQSNDHRAAPPMSASPVSFDTPQPADMSNRPGPPRNTVTGPSSQRPSAPPKPNRMRTGGGGGPGGPDGPMPISPAKLPASALAGKRTALPPGTSPSPAPTPASGLRPNPAPDDWEANFSRRFPSLSGLAMVETVIDKGPGAGPGSAPGQGQSNSMRSKEV